MVPEMKMMAVVVPVAVVHAAWGSAMATTMSTAAVPAASGRIAYGRERSGGERNRSDSDGQKCARGSHGLAFDSDRAERRTRPGEYDRAGASSRSA